MVKRSKVRFPAKMALLLKQETKDQIEQIAVLTSEPENEIVRRALDRQLPLFLDHASKTGKLLNGEVA